MKCLKPICCGISLPELLLVTAITGLTLSVALPGLSWTLNRTQVRTAAGSLVTAIETARSTAVTTGITVTLCRSNNGKSCSGSWEEGIIVFTDFNRNHMPDNSDEIVWHSSKKHPYSIKWSSFGNKQYLQFNAMGVIAFQNGNFHFCPIDNDATNGLILIVNSLGRVRLGKDTNSNGTVENSQGKEIVCPV